MGNKQVEPYYCPSFFRAQNRLGDQEEPGRVRESREPLGASLHGRVAEGRELHRGWKRRRFKDPPHLSPSCQTGYPLHRFPLPFLCLSQLQLSHYGVPYEESPRISWLVPTSSSAVLPEHSEWKAPGPPCLIPISALTIPPG